MCSCVQCPGRALPTVGSPSGRALHHPTTGCVGQLKTDPFCMYMSVGDKEQIKHKKI